MSEELKLLVAIGLAFILPFLAWGISLIIKLNTKKEAEKQ